MASKRAVAMRMEAAINRLVAAVTALGGSMNNAPANPTNTEEWATLIEAIAVGLEAVAESEQSEGESLPEDFPSRELLAAEGYTTIEAVADATDIELLAISGIGPTSLAAIRAYE